MSLIQSVRSTRPDGFAVNTPGKQVAVFTDRDGVWNEIDTFVNSPEQLRAALIPESVDAAVRFTKSGVGKLIVVTNQGGIDMGKMTEEQNLAIQQELLKAVQEKGGDIDAILFCPNARKFEVPQGEEDGRKPKAGMFYFAAQHFGNEIDLADSYMVGDMSTDIAAGENADARMTSILVETGFGGKDGHVPFQADVTVKDMATAVDYILAHEGGAA